MKPIIQRTIHIFDADAALSELLSDKKKVIGYRTKSDGHPDLLICLSKGGFRSSSESVKPETPLWGFTYLNQPSHEPRFVRSSATEAINFALGNHAKVSMWNSLDELLSIRKA